LNEHSEKILNIGFSPDGQRLATVGDDGIIRIWTLAGKKIAEFEGAWDETTRVRFSPEGKQEKYIVATEASGTIKLRRIRELNELLAEGCTLLKDYRKTHLQTQVCANR
jgi:WD40 repeat protein